MLLAYQQLFYTKPRTADPHDPNHPTNRENKSKSDKQQDSISDDFTVFNDPHDPEHPRND